MPDIRADFSRTVLLNRDEMEWVFSPGGEVQRAMLDRVGDEVAVATSLVRYPPGSRFPAHEHALGEEYLVLQGEFGDEHGRQPAGTYVRNPPGSRHMPFSDSGCVIWVKLRQFHPEDDAHVVADTSLPVPAEGTSQRELHRFRDEVVTVVAAPAGAVFELPGGNALQEILVITGAVRWRDQQIGEWGWLRVPAGEGIELTVLATCRLLHKTRPAFAFPAAAASAVKTLGGNAGAWAPGVGRQRH